MKGKPPEDVKNVHAHFNKRERESAGNPFRARRPLVVALALAELGCRLFPTHGMRSARTETGVECDCLRGRRFYAERDGYEPDPCQSPGKLPRLKGWPDAASSDPDQLRAWTSKDEGGWPFANFGVLTGFASGVWILDIDGRLGFESLAAIEAEIGQLPATWLSQSGSRSGRHYWFSASGGPAIRNSAGTLAPGIDVRGERGQAIIPGSRHRSGGYYEWEPGYAPNEVALAPAPTALVHLALEANKATRQRGTPPDAVARQRRPIMPPGRRPTPARRGGAIGDGEGRGGFHGPINTIAVRWFGRFGADACGDWIKTALREAIRTAPADNHTAQELERYLSDAYLTDRIEGARAYVQRGRH